MSTDDPIIEYRGTWMKRSRAIRMARREGGVTAPELLNPPPDPSSDRPPPVTHRWGVINKDTLEMVRVRSGADVVGFTVAPDYTWCRIDMDFGCESVERIVSAEAMCAATCDAEEMAVILSAVDDVLLEREG